MTKRKALAATRADHVPHPVDVHVGAKIRALRKIRGLSQQALAEAGGVTFQQVQKYERGANRVSASMLVRLAGALRVPPGELLDDAPGAFASTSVVSWQWDEARRIVGEVPHAFEVLQVLDAMTGEIRNALIEVIRHLSQNRARLAAE